MYGNFDVIKIITLAPELPKAMEVIQALKDHNIVVSMGKTSALFKSYKQHDVFLLGHSSSDLSTAEKAVDYGATFVTHLFNAMVSVSSAIFLIKK